MKRYMKYSILQSLSKKVMCLEQYHFVFVSGGCAVVISLGKGIAAGFNWQRLS